MGSKHRERQAVAQVACPECGAPAGTGCLLAPATLARAQREGRIIIHGERRDAWRAVRPASPIEGADILMSDQAVGTPGHEDRDTYLLLAPLSDRGRAALPTGLTRVEYRDARATLSRLRAQGLIVMREA